MEKEKPDGYVAWHHERGFYYLSFAKTKEGCEVNLACWKNSELEHAEDRLLEYQSQGWKIRPVKLTFLDED